ncbi:MAG: asparagine synthetase [Candidatus Micrarchaeota archaeon]|nr:asparagine synthetase [Candidatus Micrarchaeota archaeon]
MDAREAESLKTRLRIGSEVLRLSTDFFHDEGFIQLLPVMLGRSTDPLGPDPGSMIVKTPEVEYNGTLLYTMNSMILHKQVAVKRLGRIFILSPNIRLEKPERRATGKHLFEFTQLDFEISGASKEDVMSLVEKYFASLSKGLAKHRELFAELGVEPFEFKTPFAKYTTHELEEKYGKDWEIPASRDHSQPFWALCHKREFYDKEDEREPGHYLNYDLIYPLGFGEALSGAEREHAYDRITGRMGKDKLEMKVYQAYLDEAREGFVPSAGAGFGVERLVRFLTRSEHVGDVQMFRRVPGEEIRV